MKSNVPFPFLVIMIILIISYSCLKNPDYKPPVIHEISDEFKTFAVFDSSSYWVYQNEQNQELDTVKIIKLIHGKRFHVDQTGAPGYYYNAIEMIYHSSAGHFSKGEITAGSLYDENTTMSENYRLYYKSGRYFSVFTPKFPIGQTQLLGINEGNYKNVALHSHYLVNEMAFDSVYETAVHDYHDGNDTVFMHFFIAKHYGIVKMTKKSTGMDETWSLLSSSLSQTN